MNKFNVDDLVEKGLVKKKTYTEGPYAGLSVLKYTGRVFWDNLWRRDDRLLQCRGMVVDQDDNVIIWPFTKIFNHFENGATLPDFLNVVAVRKVNGFMASVGFRDGKSLVATTGTLDSAFATLAAEHLKYVNFENISFFDDYTFIFEICDPSDPHIVEEDMGAYLIGARHLPTGDMLSEAHLDRIAQFLGNCRRPEVMTLPFGKLVEESKRVQHEGFIVRDIDSGQLLLKIKSPHYLAKKFLMRGGVNKCDKIWDNTEKAKQAVDEEYYDLIDYLVANFKKEQWVELSEQTRRGLIENYLFYLKDQ